MTKTEVLLLVVAGGLAVGALVFWHSSTPAVAAGAAYMGPGHPNPQQLAGTPAATTAIAPSTVGGFWSPGGIFYPR